MASFRLRRVQSFSDLALLATCLNIAFLSYSSQFLFRYIDPGPLSRKSAIVFNAVLLVIWLCYYRTCTVDPGPREWPENLAGHEGTGQSKYEGNSTMAGVRWCKKCDTIKPPRAHHCKKCGRLVSIHHRLEELY